MNNDPKEKAKQLVFKFMNLVYYENSVRDAKACALICVDEILALDVAWWSEKLVGRNDIEANGTEEYWQSVKNEIEKL